MKPLLKIFIVLMSVVFWGAFCCLYESDDSSDSLYAVNPLLNLSSFHELTTREVEMDSIWYERDFRNNRARIFMQGTYNDELRASEEGANKNLPTPCDCYLHQDTLTVKMGIGFFGGFGFLIDVKGNQYNASFFEYTDDIKPYKAAKEDSEFKEYVIVQSKRQHLVFTEQPSFEIDQKLSGFLDFESNSYYTDAGSGRLDSMSVTSKIYFSCITRMKTIWD